MNSNQKGKTGERELAKKLREYGYEARRGQQYSGATGDADVVGLPGIHIECKRTERLSLYDALAQAKHDTKGGLPAVFHRKNNSEWVVIMSLDDFMKVYEDDEPTEKECDHCGGMVDITDQYCPECKTTIHWGELA